MTQCISRRRRFAVAGCALVLAGTVFRCQIAQALVVRGDDFLYRGRSAAALSRYARALALDPDLGTAADHYVFVSMERHTAPALRSSIVAADAYLARHPADSTVLADRALCRLLEKRYGAARRDFEAAGRASQDPREYVFGGWAAERSGDAVTARRLWRTALALDAHYRPAMLALKEAAR